MGKSLRATLREEALRRSEKLSEAERSEKAAQAAAILAQSPIFKASTHIACYLALRSEMETFPIIEAIWAQKKECYLPIVHPKKRGLLYFGAYRKSTPLVKSRLGIKEPSFDEDSLVLCEPEELDLVVMPLLAFDSKGHRIGKGGGYYDRTFEFMNESPRPEKPFLCGLAFSSQELPEIEAEPWDVPLDAIVTEKEMRHFR